MFNDLSALGKVPNFTATGITVSGFPKFAKMGTFPSALIRVRIEAILRAPTCEFCSPLRSFDVTYGPYRHNPSKHLPT